MLGWILLCSRRVLPVRVRAQYGDGQDKVHHERDQHHAQTQQDGSVLPSPQSRDRFPFVQHVVIAALTVVRSEGNTSLDHVVSW